MRTRIEVRRARRVIGEEQRGAAPWHDEEDGDVRRTSQLDVDVQRQTLVRRCRHLRREHGELPVLSYRRSRACSGGDRREQNDVAAASGAHEHLWLAHLNLLRCDRFWRRTKEKLLV